MKEAFFLSLPCPTMTAPPRRFEDKPSTFAFFYHPAAQALGLGLATFVLCLFGIYSRPASDLAALWPANAFALGMMVRFPQLATGWSWLAIAAAYWAADGITGSSWQMNLLINTSNLASVAAGYGIFRMTDPQLHGLRHPMSVLYMLLAVLCAAIAAGVFGAMSMPYLFNEPLTSAFTAWFGAEIVNATAFLPLILTLPQKSKLPNWRQLRQQTRLRWRHALPALAVVLSAALGSWLGGPGAIAFTVPALMWCAISYHLFTVALLTFMVSTWSLLHLSLQLPLLPSGSMDRSMLLSARIGMSLIMLSPLMIGIVTATNRQLVERLRTLADQDQLTGVPNRRAFLEAAHAQMSRLQREQLPCAVLMLDIDYFKRVNDCHGHAAGDAVLRQFGHVLRECLRSHDIMGRLGGEEFAVLLPRTTLEEAQRVADRIRQRLLDTPIALEHLKAPLRCTVSVGLAAEAPTVSSLDALLGRADAGLYAAKAHGRNIVVHQPPAAKRAVALAQPPHSLSVEKEATAAL